MSMLGGDAPALFGFAGQLTERRRNIAATSARLGAMVRDAHWVGPDRDQFVAEWSERHAPALMGICNDLDAAAARVTKHANAQEETSGS